jgi:hypothetical protein
MDMLKQVTLAGKYKAEARLADLAAREMAKHCDARIKKLRKTLEQIEYALRKDSFCDSERVDSARQLVQRAMASLDHGESPPDREGT